VAAAPDYDPAKWQRLARAIWRAGRDPRGTLAEAYLTGRGLPLFDAVAVRVLRFHPALWLDENRPTVPGLIAAFRPTIGDLHPDTPPAAIHRIFLNPDGSAIRDEHGKRLKRMLGPSKGCAIKLTADEEVASGLGIVEGIEDGLGRLATGWAPIWALGSTEGIKRLPVLSGIECLTIFADHDAKGQGIAAAKVCSDRWREAGIEVITRIRNKTGDDWADGEGEQ
jgi:putative DNA primase/helicase